jgi:Clostripain family
MRVKKPWAVFVYLVADDHGGSTAPALDDTAENELDLMFEGVDRRNIHLAVQVDYRNTRKVWRYLERQPESSLPESSASDPRTIEGFLDWACETSPAERHVLLFWGHAFGTAGLFPDSRPDAPLSRDLLSLTELGSVLSHANELMGQAVDVVMFKNCCLSNVETAYQLQDRAELMIASQARVPAKGWPYERLLNALVHDRRGDLSTEQIGRRLVRQLANHYADTLPVRDVPVTLLRLGAARLLRDPVTRLSEALLDTRDHQSVRWVSTVQDALRRAAFAGDPAMPDVANLCRYLRDPSGPYSRTLAEAAQAVEHVVTRQLVLAHYSKTSAFNGAGIFYGSADAAARSNSIVADAADPSEYVRLAFCRDTGWDDIAIDTPRRANRFQQPAEVTAF